MTVAIGTWAGFGNAIVGHDAHLFEGLDVQIKVEDNPTVLSAGLGKSFMVVQSSMDYAAQMLANGVDGKVLLVTDESSGGDAILADPSIKSISDLVGRRVGFTAGPASEWLLVSALAKEGKTLKDLQVKVFDDPLSARDSYIKGELDALAIWEPFLNQIKARRNSNVIVSSRDLPERVFGVLIASREMLNNRELTMRFLQGWFAADDYRTTHPDEAARMIAKLLQATPEETAWMLNGTKIASAKRNQEFFVSPSEAEPPKLERLMREALEYWRAKGEVKNDARLESPISSEATEFFRSK